LENRCLSQRTQIVGLTVDHKLRPESTDEALMVQSWLGDMGIGHHILTWHHDNISTGIQTKARHARYDLVSRWCLDNGCNTAMAAHHLDDQWETFMMRLAKGSGLTGLSCIKGRVQTSFGQLIRPLLQFPSSALRDALRAFGQENVEDPSNQNTKYERVNWRKNKEMLGGFGLTPQHIYNTVTQLQQAEDYLERQTNDAIESCACDDGGWRLDLVRDLPVAIAFRFLKNIAYKTGGAKYPMGHRLVGEIYKAIMDKNFSAVTANGCLFKRSRGGVLKITKEPGRQKIL